MPGGSNTPLSLAVSSQNMSLFALLLEQGGGTLVWTSLMKMATLP